MNISHIDICGTGRLFRTALILLILIISLPAGALDFNLLLQADYYGDLEPDTPYETLRCRFYAGPELSGGIFGKLDFFLSANLYYQPLDEETFVRADNILREGYLGFHGTFFDLYLGQRYVNWGKVDFYSPINVVNPLDTTVLSLDNMREWRLPDLMADLQLYFGSAASLEIIYKPFLRPYYYPDETWEIYVDYFNIDVDAAFSHREVPYLSEEAHSVYTSFNYWSYWFDLILSYSWYTDPYPDFDLSGITQDIDSSGFFKQYTIRGEALNCYNRAHLIGFGISTSFSGWGLDLESGLKITEDWEGTQVETKNSEVITNLQINKTFFNAWFTQFNVIHRYIINHGAEPDSELHSMVLGYLQNEMERVFLQPEESQIYLAGHLHRYAFHETLYMGLNGGVGFALFYEEEYETELYLAPRAAYRLTDRITFEAGADLYFQGEEAGYLGRNVEKDNFYVRIKAEF